MSFSISLSCRYYSIDLPLTSFLLGDAKLRTVIGSNQNLHACKAATAYTAHERADSGMGRSSMQPEW